MKIRIFSTLALAAVVSLAACGGDDAAEGEGDVVTQDTTAIPGTDTVTQPAIVPTTDSVVTTTTVDTIPGEAGDSVADTTRAP